MIDTVIFDMDGVLIDAKEWHYQALNMSLNIFGEQISRDEHIHSFDGLSTNQKLVKLNKQKRIPEGLNPLINRLKQQYTVELIANKCKPFFPHQFLLSQLKISGYKIGLASNSIRETVDLMLSRAQIADYFDLTLSNNDVNLPKPNPQIYQKAIQLLSSSPSTTLVIEDNQHGVEAAKSAGAFVLEVSDIHEVNFKQIFRQIEKVNSCK